MKALITGGTGFIGSWIAKALIAKGFDIRSFDIKDDRSVPREILGADADRVDWITGDITDSQALVKAASGCDLLVHLAAILTPDCARNPVRGAEICLIGSLNVFEAARQNNIGRVLFMSSAGVFGPEDDGVNPRPTTLYGAYKLAVEGAARAYWDDHAIASVGFRPLIVYGPGRETGLTAGPSLACKAAAQGDDYVIPFSGDTDFIYVSDVAAAYAAAAIKEQPGAHVYNVVGDLGTAEGFAEEIMRAAPNTNVRADGPTLPIAPQIDPGSLREDYPDIPQTTIREGIAETVAHYRRGRNA
ncbi:MAG: NAD(P)-dependent oxidoreductase [Pseudomonadota bacterium]